MKEIKPVTVSKSAFNFCKYTMAVIFWSSVIFRIKELAILGCVLLLLSAFLKVEKAPLVLLYSKTIDKFNTSKKEVLDENSVFFAHIVGAIMSGIGILFLYYINTQIGWILIGILAFLKTSASFGFCGAMKLYTCLNNPNGKCCRFGKKIKNNKCNL